MIKKIISLALLFKITVFLATPTRFDTQTPNRENYPLHYYATRGFKNRIEMLIDSGDHETDESNHLGRTALHYAALMGQKQTVERLLELGAEPEVLDCDARMPEDLANLNGFKDLSRLLRLYRKSL